MGYRIYLGTLSKKKYEEIKDLNIDELMIHYPMDNYWYKGVYDYDEKQLYELGKYVDFKQNAEHYTHVFSNEKVRNYYSEYDFFIITKEFLKNIIKSYENNISEYYSELSSKLINSDFHKSIKYDHSEKLHTADFNLLSETEKDAIIRSIIHIEDIKREWLLINPYNIDKGEEITTSYRYEYAIFELIRIYKTFDWENNHMIYYGY